MQLAVALEEKMGGVDFIPIRDKCLCFHELNSLNSWGQFFRKIIAAFFAT